MPLTGLQNRTGKNLILFLLVSAAALMALTSGLYENKFWTLPVLLVHPVSVASAILFIYSLNDGAIGKQLNRVALSNAAGGTLLLIALYPYGTAGWGLVASGLCALLYYEKLPGIPLPGAGLRRIAFVKNILIGLGWSFAVGPLRNNGLFFFQMMFISALSLLSDVADFEIDRSRDVKTAAVIAGIPAVSTIAAIIFAALLTFVWYKNPALPAESLSLQLACIAGLCITPLVAIKRQHAFSPLWIECTLWLYALSRFITCLNTKWS